MSNQDIWAAVDSYFEHVEQAKEESLRSIREAFRRLGSGVILAAFTWVAERLEKEGVASTQMALMGVPDAMLNLRIFGLGEQIFRYLEDVVRLEAEVGLHLAASIMATHDEDEQALMAYVLATRFAASLDQWNQTKMRVFLKNYLR